jgi:hypothetical protein
VGVFETLIELLLLFKLLFVFSLLFFICEFDEEFEFGFVCVFDI